MGVWGMGYSQCQSHCALSLPGPVKAEAGHAHLDEGEDEAHREVGQPVDCAPHHEGGRTGGLQEGLSDNQWGDGTYIGKGGLFSGTQSPSPMWGALACGPPQVCFFQQGS